MTTDFLTILIFSLCAFLFLLSLYFFIVSIRGYKVAGQAEQEIKPILIFRERYSKLLEELHKLVLFYKNDKYNDAETVKRHSEFIGGKNIFCENDEITLTVILYKVTELIKNLDDLEETAERLLEFFEKKKQKKWQYITQEIVAGTNKHRSILNEIISGSDKSKENIIYSLEPFLVHFINKNKLDDDKI